MNDLEKNNLDKKSEELYNILKLDRIKLKNYLDINNKYEDLKKILYNIECLYSHDYDGNFIKDLFLGKIGYEYNKQMAIYNFPTESLIKAIDEIVKLLDIEIIQEIGSGLGLLSYQINKYIKIPLVATDGKNWLETNSFNNYYSVIKKDILEYNEFDNNKKKLFILSWLINNNSEEINKFIEKVKPSNILFINNDNLYSDELFDNLKTKNYNIIRLPLKMLSYKDYFKKYIDFNNITLDKVSCRQKLYLAILNCENNNVNENINLDILKDKIGINHFDINDNKENNYILIDLVSENILPVWILNLKDEDHKKAIYLVNKILIEGKLVNKIPNWINNLRELEFWYKQKIKFMFPILIKTNEKFVEYFNFMKKIDTINGIDDLKLQYILPFWIDSYDNASKFFWLEFSTKNKKWKNNFNSFLANFRLLFSRI